MALPQPPHRRPLLKMRHKSQNADDDEVNRDDKVKQTRDQENENSGNQGNQRIEHDKIESHGSFPLRWSGTPDSAD